MSDVPLTQELHEVDAEGVMTVPVRVPRDARQDNWAYSDFDRCVLVSFVVTLPADAYDEEGDFAEDASLRELFDLRVDAVCSYSHQLVAVHDLGDQ